MRIHPLSTILLLLFSSAVPAQPTPDLVHSDIATLRQILETSKRRSQLEMDGAPPFHMKATITWPTSGGEQWAKGTLEELWKDPHHYSRTIHFDNHDLLEIDNGTQAWRTGQPVLPFGHGLEEALKPFIQLPSGDRLTAEGQHNGSKDLDCIGTEPELPGVGREVKLADTSFCMARGNHLLRLIGRPNGLTIVFNDIQPFRNKYIARSVEVDGGNVPIFRLTIDSLDTAEDFSSLDVPPPADAQLLAITYLTQVSLWNTFAIKSLCRPCWWMMIST